MLLALREFDLKRILAWSTVATLGTLVFIVGMPGYQASHSGEVRSLTAVLPWWTFDRAKPAARHAR